MIYLLIALIAYLIGNITGSYIISKLAFSEDIRTKGSGNAGTTNMLRTYGLVPALVTLAIDIGKGYLATYIAHLIEPNYGTYLAGVLVVVGHCWPIVLGFKGGKGMATSGGVMLFHTPMLLISVMVIFFLVNYIGKIMSLTSLIIVVYTVIYMFIFYNHDYYLIGMVIILAIIVFYSHRSNIKRLSEGKENKISIKR